LRLIQAHEGALAGIVFFFDEIPVFLDQGGSFALQYQQALRRIKILQSFTHFGGHSDFLAIENMLEFFVYGFALMEAGFARSSRIDIVLQTQGDRPGYVFFPKKGSLLTVSVAGSV
jgi:hypothetical protein